jgi:hypothetical protein
MVYNAMKLFMEINPGLFDECSENYRENEATAAQTLRNRTERWATVADWARQRSNGEVAAIPPMTDLKGQKFNPPTRIDEDPITQDSQKRLDALRLQDESSGGRDGRRQRGPDGQYQVSSISTISPLQARQALHPVPFRAMQLIDSSHQALEDPAAQIRQRLERNGSNGGPPMPAPATTRQGMLDNVPRAG